VIPLRDENPIRHVPYVTLAIIALNVLAFLLWEPTLGHHSVDEQQAFFYCHAEVPWEITHQQSLAEGGGPARQALEEELQLTPSQATAFQGFLKQTCDHKSWWEAVFTAMFLHGGWLHIAGNMLFLWIFGNNVEDSMGRPRFVLFYLLCGVLATLAQWATAMSSDVPNIGASGAIAGVLGGYLLLFPRARVTTLLFLVVFFTWLKIPAWVVLGSWFLLQLVDSSVGEAGGVAYFAHVGGFVSGLLLIRLFARRMRPPAPPPRPEPTWF
jgi:membrane associated rhomboid family serine protease